MRKVKSFLIMALPVLFCSAAHAGDVVKDTLGTMISSAKTVETLLQGQVAGVRVWSQDGTPMSASGVSIRGVNSLRGGHEPLYVVDGAVLNGSSSMNMDPLWQHGSASYISPLSQLAYIAPSEIESIEVLKNTSALALYGPKAANGVVIINTRRIKGKQSAIYWNSNVDVTTPDVKGYARTGISHSHNVMLGGGRNATNYTLSAYFRDDNYIFPGTGGMKGGVRAAFDTKANPVVWFGFNSVLSVASTASPASTAWYGSESLTCNMRKEDAQITGLATDYDDDATDYRTVNSMWLKLNLFKGFSVNIDLGADYKYSTRMLWWGKGTAIGAENNGAAAILKTSAFSYNATGMVRYERYFASDHYLDFSATAQILGNTNVMNTQNGTDFYNHSLRAKGLNIAASKARIHSFETGKFEYAVLGKVAYRWKNIVGADVTVRSDWAPEYDSNVIYPYANGFWDVRNAFFKSSKAVSNLRLEGGYGESGNNVSMPYELFGLYTSGPYPAVDPEATAFYSGRNVIHTKEWNVALQMGFLDDRLNLEVGYYDRKTSDRLSFYTFGHELVVAPGGLRPGEEFEEGDQELSKLTKYWDYKEREETAVQESVIGNKGIEFSLSGVPIRTKDWNWMISVNGAYNMNRMVKVAAEDASGKSVGGLPVISGGVSQIKPLIATGNIEGEPVSSILDDDEVIGNPTPEYYGGLSTALRWKDLTLDILADGAAGFDILNLNAMLEDKRKDASEKYVEKGDFLRLARVSVSYDIPVRKVKWLKSFKVFATASNLAVISDYSGWSPDVNSFAASNYTLGMDYASCPSTRSFVLGLSLKF